MFALVFYLERGPKGDFKMMVVDISDCVEPIGHDFRIRMLKLGVLEKLIKKKSRQRICVIMKASAFQSLNMRQGVKKLFRMEAVSAWI